MNKRNTGAMLRQNFSALKRAVKKLFGYYPRLAPLTAFCILFSAVVSSVPSLCSQDVLCVIENWDQTGDWASARPESLR